MTNTWTTNADGSVSFNGTIRFPAGTNLASGAGVAIFGPNGGTTNFPAVQKGDPGPSPTFTVQMQEVSPTTPLPSPNPAVLLSSNAGTGLPPNYTLIFYVHAGQDGLSAGTTILSATDLEGLPQAGYSIGFSVPDGKAQWQPKLCGGWYYNNTIPATTFNTNATKPMTSISVPPQPFNWWPEPHAYGTVIGAVDTRVDLVARVNSITGPECGRGLGATGTAPPPVTCIPNGLATGSGNIVTANSAATIFLNAENQVSSANPWNTTSAAFFQVKVSPVPS